jgi:uncharacterized protein YdaU (DUF1376 family)
MMVSPKKLNPYLNLDIPNYLNESRRMTASAKGVYLDLMVYATQNGGVVPKDETALRKIANVTLRTWNQVREDVLAALEPCQEGYRSHHACKSKDQYEQVCEKMKKVRAGQQDVHGRNTHDGVNLLKSLDGTRRDRAQTANGKEQIQKEDIDIESSNNSSASLDDWPDDLSPEQEQQLLEQAENPNVPASNLPVHGYPPVANGSQTLVTTPARPAGERKGPKTYRDYDHRDWRDVARRFDKYGDWHGNWGPAPGEAGCLLPPELCSGPDW